MYKLKHLQTNEKWQPTKNLYFRKYCFKIELLPSEEQYLQVSKPHRQKVQYRHNPKTNTYDIFNTIYTADPDFLIMLINNFDYNCVFTPINDEHEKVLKTNKDNKIVIRDQLYYRKYKYRIEVSQNWRLRSSSNQEQTIKDCHEFVKKTFVTDESKFRHMYSNFWYSLPYIYTNDLKSTMLLKLAYSDTLRIVVSEVTTYDDLK